MPLESWQLQDAKSRFSFVVEQAINQGPQLVTKHGQPAVIVLSVEEYQRLTSQDAHLVDRIQLTAGEGV